MQIPYAKPSITDLECSYAAEACRSGWGSECYTYISLFEKGFAEHIGIRYAHATSSCTGALTLCLAALGIGPGDEVILADINWVATASPILHLGARPVFADVLPDTWCIDPASIERLITDRTRAIIATHLYGSPCDIEALLAIGSGRGIPVIEDAAEAIGTSIDGRAAGSFGICGVFSFHGTKTLTTGEGGMFVTDDAALMEKVEMLNKHGQNPSGTKQFWAEVAGYKFKMSNIQAAIGCAQLSRLPELLARKREIFHAYAERLDGLPLAMNCEPPGTVNGYWMTTAVVKEGRPFDRDRLLAEFLAKGIDARVFFWPLSLMPPFKTRVVNPVAHALHLRAFNLPSYHDITHQGIETVCRVVRDFLSR